MQSETQRKNIHANYGPAVSLKPGWFPVYKRLFLREKSLFLAAPALVASAFGRHGRFPPHARKTSGYPGYQSEYIFWWEEENPCLNKRRQDKIRNWLITLLKTKYIKIRDLIAYKHSWVFSSDILEEDNEKFRDFFWIDLHQIFLKPFTSRLQCFSSLQ